MLRAVRARAALSAATAGECRDAVLVAGAQVHDLGAVLDRQCDGLLAGGHWHLETIKMVGPPDACGASRSWHQLAEWEQCGEIDSARLMVVVGSSPSEGRSAPILVAFGRPVYRTCGWSPLEA
jgi:hypothetical protein